MEYFLGMECVEFFNEIDCDVERFKNVEWVS